MICFSCDTENWHSMGDISKVGEMLVCKGCGAVAYKVDADAEAKMRKFYRTEYRPEPSLTNLITTNHKLQYVRVFLKEFLEGLGEKKIFFGDIGCATGYLIAFFKMHGHRATGCEYTLTFRRFCEKWYGTPIPEDLYRKRPYGLLSLYHVLEHMVEPDKKLADFASLLDPQEGRFLISTPEWFDTLEEASGTQMQSFEGLFPKPHINIFSRTAIQNLFRKAGLEIVKEDHVQYGQSYLLKRGPAQAIVVEDWKEMVEKIKKTKAAIGHYLAGDEQKALEIWPKFPEAWMRLLMEKAMKDPQRQADIYARAEAHVSQNARWRATAGWWHFQHRRYDDALKSLQYVMQRKPNEETAMSIGAVLMETGRWDEAFAIYNEAAAINPMKWAECMTLMCKCASMSPAWDERAMQALGQAAVQAAPAPAFSDPALEDAPAMEVK